jgi:hypothetical protein
MDDPALLPLHGMAGGRQFSRNWPHTVGDWGTWPILGRRAVCILLCPERQVPLTAVYCMLRPNPTPTSAGPDGDQKQELTALAAKAVGQGYRAASLRKSRFRVARVQTSDKKKQILPDHLRGVAR